MLTATLNGWSAASRKPGGRITSVVAEVIGHPPEWYGTSRLASWQCRRLRSWLVAHQDSSESLLLVGKSLGGWHMLTRVVNLLPRLEYRRIGLVTVDPCHPRWWDWAPDRSGDTVPLHSRRVDGCYNLLSGKGSRPRGACVQDSAQFVVDADHWTITTHHETREAIAAMAARLREQHACGGEL